MDSKRTDRESDRSVVHVTCQLTVAILVGAVIFGLLLGLEGLSYAINAGPEIPNKGGPPYTVLEWTLGSFLGGAFFGGFIGAIAGSVQIVIDWLRKLFPTT